MTLNIEKLSTESVNEKTRDIDVVPTIDMLRMINDEDKKVAYCVEKKLPAIAAAVDAIAERYARGGRLIYAGAGTSGRIGAMDAAECPPTFGVPGTDVVGLMAGSKDALTSAKEGVEDHPEYGAEDLRNVELKPVDSVVGIAASGRTPYVIGALKYAREAGALTISVTCNERSEMDELANIAIAVDVGPEALTGSTRMKAGTAQKMILNMLSTGLMIKSGKTYGNLMVSLTPKNGKLVDRAARIVASLTGASFDEAMRSLEACDMSARCAIVTIKTGLSPRESREELAKRNWRTRETLSALGANSNF